MVVDSSCTSPAEQGLARSYHGGGREEKEEWRAVSIGTAKADKQAQSWIPGAPRSGNNIQIGKPLQ